MIISLLLAVAATSWMYSWSLFSRNKVELILQLSEIADKIALPYHVAELSLLEPDKELLIPIQGLRVRDIADTWGDARSQGRSHEGTDIFAKRGTPVFSATKGYVMRVGTNTLGGNIVFVVGAGGVRYYYAHLDSSAKGIKVGTGVTTDTVIGFVGNTGNASGTPPHLHFGMYKNGAQNPYTLLVGRK